MRIAMDTSAHQRSTAGPARPQADVHWVTVGGAGGTYTRLAMMDASGPARWLIHARGGLSTRFDRLSDAGSEYLYQVTLPNLPRTIPPTLAEIGFDTT